MTDYDSRGHASNDIATAQIARRQWDFRTISQNIIATVVSTALIASVGGWYHFSGSVDANAHDVGRNADTITRISEQQQRITDELAAHIIYSRGLHAQQRDYVDGEADKLDARLRQCQQRVGALAALMNNRADF